MNVDAEAVEAVATVDPLLYVLAGALGAAGLTAVAGFIGAWINSRRDHKRWEREQRLDAYRGFLRMTEQVWPMQSKEQADWRAHQDAMSSALGEVTLVGPNEVLTAATVYLDAVLDFASVQRKLNGVEDGVKRPELQRDFEAAAVKANALRDQLVLSGREALRIEG
jgi:hypothetical protein